MIDSPEQGCFLCDPERWRIVFEGRSVRVVAGLGPLCPGYILLSPREHFHTASSLPSEILNEFLATADILTDALDRQFGVGYSAYEHGQLGACRPLEITRDYSSFCHHCHRVFIPVETDCAPRIREWFRVAEALPGARAITRHSGHPYVYYETGRTARARERWAFSDDQGIPSQFMRRVLSNELGTGRHYSWTSEPRYPEMIETISRLRAELAGLSAPDRSVIRRDVDRLLRHVTIDGFSGAGKTTVSQMLGRCVAAPVIDSGVAWRLFAYERARGNPDPTPESLLHRMRAPVDSLAFLRTPELGRLVRDLSADAFTRDTVTTVIRRAIAVSEPSIVVGRDAWRMVEGEASRFVLKADFDLRARRRFLDAARCGAHSDLSGIEADLRVDDAVDLPKLPPPDARDITMVDNGHHPLDVTVNHLLARTRDPA